MNSKPTPQSLLHDIAQIQHLDRGTLSVIRHGPAGPYYNHQCYENGRNVSRYVPAEQVADLNAALDGYRQVQSLLSQYVQLMVEKTRAERMAHAKKKTRHPQSSSRKTRKSGSGWAGLKTNPPTADVNGSGLTKDVFDQVREGWSMPRQLRVEYETLLHEAKLA